MSAPCHIGCDRVVVEFALAIRPKTKDRAQRNGRRSYTDPRGVAYEGHVGTIARQAMRRPRVESGDVEVLYLFELRSARHAGDLDNLEKAVMDALNGVAYKDDRQVAVNRSRRILHADADRVSVAVLAVTA